jgi:hypothetical protein
LRQTKQLVGQKRHDGGRNSASEDHAVIDHRETAKDELTQPAGSDGGCYGGQSNANHSRDANASNDNAGCQRQLHMPENLAAGHSHGGCGLADWRVHSSDSDKRVLDNGQQCVEHQGENGETIGPSTEPRQRKEQPKQRKAGDGLNDVAAAKNQPTIVRTAGEENPKRHANGYGQQHGDRYQPKMLSGQREHLALVTEDEIKHKLRLHDQTSAWPETPPGRALLLDLRT